MILDRLNHSHRRTVPHIYQAELAECGIASLAMVAGYYGQHYSMPEMRKKFPPSAKGATLADLMRFANSMGMAARPVKMELEHLKDLKLPAILHWDFGHFVVVTKVAEDSIDINDPAMGRRTISMPQVSKHFTGVALELTLTDTFKTRAETKPLTLSRLVGKVRGFTTAGLQVLVAALLLELTGLALPYMSQLVTDNVLVNSDSSLLTGLGVGFLMLVVMRGALSWARDWSLALLTTGIRAQVAEKVFRHALRLPPQFFERRRATDIANRFASLQEIERTLATTFIQTVLDSVFATLILLVVLGYSTTLGVMVIVAAVVYGLVRWALYEPTRQHQLSVVEHRAKQDGSLLESLRAIVPVQLAGKTTWRLAQWEVHLADATNAQIAQVRLDSLGRTANTVIVGLLTVLVLWAGASQVLDSTLTLGALFAVMAYQQGVMARLATLVESVSQFKLLSVQLGRLADIVCAEPQSLEPPKVSVAAEAEATAARQTLSFELKNVSFRYSETEPKVLDGVSLVIDHGDNLAVVGASGCGKSTLLKVLTGVVEPTEGEVLVNGIPVKDFGITRLRELSSVVLQDDVIFYGTVADNISYFDDVLDSQKLAYAASAAVIHDDIMKMPMQYQSLTGEGGSILSGGQRQRLLLARALYRKPCALFLDEATSSLDIATEDKVSGNLAQLAATRVAIAHRPETIRRAKRAVVLAEGKVLFDGTPDQALAVQAELTAQLAQAAAPAMAAAPAPAT